VQKLDRAGLRARLLSSSYVPAAGHPWHEPMLASLENLFDAHQVDGTVAMEYELRAYAARWGHSAFNYRASNSEAL
jgi:hypothetical protein